MNRRIYSDNNCFVRKRKSGFRDEEARAKYLAEPYSWPGSGDSAAAAGKGRNLINSQNFM